MPKGVMALFSLDLNGVKRMGVVETPGEPRSKEPSDPAPKMPPEAKMSAGAESKGSEGPRSKGPKGPRIEGSRRLVCKRCGHFFMEVKSKEFEAATICSRCKTENFFAYQELKQGL